MAKTVVVVARVMETGVGVAMMTMVLTKIIGRGKCG